MAWNISYYTKIHGVAPAEADLQRYFQTSPPSIHQMIVTLERRGFIVEIGHFDRMEGIIHRVALQEITFPEGERRMLELVDESGVVRRIPFHRIREVYRDGELIWHRPA